MCVSWFFGRQWVISEWRNGNDSHLMVVIEIMTNRCSVDLATLLWPLMHCLLFPPAQPRSQLSHCQSGWSLKPSKGKTGQECHRFMSTCWYHTCKTCRKINYLFLFSFLNKKAQRKHHGFSRLIFISLCGKSRSAVLYHTQLVFTVLMTYK